MFINSNRSLQEHTSSLEAHRKEYNAYNKEIQAGALGPAPINAATNFGYALLNALHAIEAQRVLAELQSLSTRVHGADHSSTKQIEKVHNHMKFRCVLVDLQGSGKKDTKRPSHSNITTANSATAFFMLEDGNIISNTIHAYTA